jgi:hypothetical protein
MPLSRESDQRLTASLSTNAEAAAVFTQIKQRAVNVSRARAWPTRLPAARIRGPREYVRYRTAVRPARELNPAARAIVCVDHHAPFAPKMADSG